MPSTEYKRSDRIADVIHHEVADMLMRKVKDPRVAGVTVSGVEVTPDLRHARIFYCVSGNPTEEERKTIELGLKKAVGFVRSELGRRLQLRYVPGVEFRYDASFEYGDRIERLLKGLHDD